MTAIGARILGLISRPSTSGGFVPEMDGLRFVAIAWVVLYHVAALRSPDAPAALRAVSDSGHYGVELFFIISGFVLALPFATWRLKQGGPVVLKRYYLRRLTRLEPPYILSLLIFFALKLVTKGESAGELARHLLASTTYLHNLIYAQESTISVVAWSLEVEVQFYLLAPLLGRVFLIERRAIRSAVFLALIAGCVLLSATHSRNDAPRLFLSLPAFLQYFLIGFLFAEAYLLGNWRDQRKGALAFDALGIGAFVVLVHVIFRWYDDPIGQTAGPLLLALFCVCAFHGKALNAFFRNPWIYSFGGMCYTIYLYHSLFVHAATAAAGRLHLPAGLAAIGAELILAVGSVAVLCPVIYVIAERPFMKPDWPQRLKRRIAG